MERLACRRSLVGPLVLIGLGVVFLLNNLGYLGWGVWETILRLWPLLLIAVGLEILLGQRFAWGSVAAVLIVLGVAGLMVLLSGVTHLIDRPLAGEVPLAGQTIAEALDGARRAEIEIEAGIGRLTLGALEDGATLLEGAIRGGYGEEIYRTSRREGDQVFLSLRRRRPGLAWDRHGRDEDWAWTVNLNQQVPMRVRIDTGVGLADIDLSRIRASEVAVKTGVGRTNLTLPAAGVVQARCEGGIGEINITIPRGMATRIRASAGIGVVEINGRRLHGSYVSPGYEQAKDRVDLEVKGGIGKIAIADGGW